MRILIDDATFDCKNSGAMGLLCEVPPLSNGECNAYFNTEVFEYDGGDCCGATCDSPRCGLAALDFAFGHNLTAIGNGFPNCKDESMVTLTIFLMGSASVLGYRDMNLECEGIQYLVVFDDEELEAQISDIQGVSQTVKVNSGTECTFSVDYLYSVSNIRVVQEFQDVDYDLLRLDVDDYSFENTGSFSVVASCLLDDLFESSPFPEYNSSQHQALAWTSDRLLVGDTLAEFDCGGSLLQQMYALAVLAYSFDDISFLSSAGWLSMTGPHCNNWNGVGCNTDFSITQINFGKTA